MQKEDIMHRLTISSQVLRFMDGVWLGESIELENRYLLARMLLVVYIGHLKKTKVIRKDFHRMTGIPARTSYRLLGFARERRWIMIQQGAQGDRRLDCIVPTKILVTMMERTLEELVPTRQHEAS